MEERLIDVISPLVADREPTVLRKPGQSVRSTTHLLCLPSFSELSMPFLAMRLLTPRFFSTRAHFLSHRRLCRHAASWDASSVCQDTLSGAYAVGHGAFGSERWRPWPPPGPSSRGRWRRSSLPRAGHLCGRPQGGASCPLLPYPSDSGRVFGPLFGREARRVQRCPLPIYLVHFSQTVQEPPMQTFPHACRLSLLQAPPEQVMPEPQPISWGSISQGMPLFSTNRMPVRAARSSMRGLCRPRVWVVPPVTVALQPPKVRHLLTL